MLISNSWDTSCGKFLCGYSGIISHMDFTKTLNLRRTFTLALSDFRKFPWLRSSSEQKPIFRGRFALLHSLLSPAGPRPGLFNPMYRVWGRFSSLSTELEFLQRKRREVELKNDTFLQVRMPFPEPTGRGCGQERRGDPSKGEEVAQKLSE